MLSDMLKDLKQAINNNDTKKTTKLYKDLEKLGMDMMTANILITSDNVEVVSIVKDLGAK